MLVPHNVCFCMQPILLGNTLGSDSQGNQVQDYTVALWGAGQNQILQSGPGMTETLSLRGNCTFSILHAGSWVGPETKSMVAL